MNAAIRAVVRTAAGAGWDVIGFRRGFCGLIDDDVFTFLWVDAFPMFEWDEDEERWNAVHHPFTRPTAEWGESFDAEPAAALAEAYDLIVNGN